MNLAEGAGPLVEFVEPTPAPDPVYVLWQRRPTKPRRWQAVFEGSEKACGQEMFRIVDQGGSWDFCTLPQGQKP